MRRSKLALGVAKVVGPSVLVIDDEGSGWPSSARVLTDSGPVAVALHVGPVGLSHRGRDDTERRFQNPGSDRPVEAKPDQIPILLGIWEEEGRAVFVCMDARNRIGKTTRVSLFVPLELLRAAAARGWEEHQSTSDEHIFAFLPQLLPAYVQLLRSGVSLDPGAVATVASAAGILQDSEGAMERGRRTISALIRDAMFSRSVRQAYGGLCAMCGLNFSLVVGAHIHPVAAKGSFDKVWNGIALCHNHHVMFDSHRIFIDPVDRQIVLHPDLLTNASRSEACSQFIEGTFGSLAQPAKRGDLPKREMFERRYDYFSSKYDWAT